MSDNKLIEIVKSKGFKNPQSTLEYLIDIGCEEREVITILGEVYSQGDYFRDVAFGSILGIMSREMNGTIIVGTIIDWVLSIGMISESNERLRPMFDSYKQAVCEGKVDENSQKDLESLCDERYRFINLTDTALDFFREIATLHYGYSILDTPDNNKVKN